VRRLPFKNNFIFKYSPRPGTVAIDRFADDVPDEVKRWRNNALLAVQSETSARVHAAWVGRAVDVLFDGVRAHVAAPARAAGAVAVRVGGREVDGQAVGPAERWQAVGRTAGDLIVAVDVADEAAAIALRGGIRRVHLAASRPLLLTGSWPADGHLAE
jgi:tRNA-2-methylthio-N6-dimethylallyladenosine synthase